MKKAFLPESTKKTIVNGIDVLFESLKQRLLGSFYSPKIKIDNLTHDKLLSLPGLYTSAYLDASPNNRPTTSTVQALADVAESYISSSAEKAKANALVSVNNALKDAFSKKDFNYEKTLNNALVDVFDQAHGEVKKVVETELHRAKTIGLQEGILDVMQSQGIDDPTVAFLTRKDAFVCKFCKSFFLQPDGVTPRVYKLSELSSGYLNKKNPQPVLPPVHPNCFLHGEGRVYTQKGFKKIRNVSFQDKVYTHFMRWRSVVNTLNFLKVPYKQSFYEIKIENNKESICITPDHKVFTNNGMKVISELDYGRDKLIKAVKKCTICNNKMLFNHPAYFCSGKCRDVFFNNLSENVDKIQKTKVEFEEFSPYKKVNFHEHSEPTFLYDITVDNDHSLVYNGLVTHNCRCLMIGVYSGFTFNKNGGLEYKHEGYDEYENQKSLKKNTLELMEFLNHDCDEHRDNELLLYLK